jgi:hypothetical protein
VPVPRSPSHCPQWAADSGGPARSAIACPSSVRSRVVSLEPFRTQVRQRVIRETEGRRGRKTDPAWAARRRLLTGHERLRPETFAKMWNSLIDTGDAGC